MRKVLRKKAVLDATGWSNSTLYQKIKEGRFPRGVKIDPAARSVVWWEDEVAAFQQRAVEAAEKAA